MSSRHLLPLLLLALAAAPDASAQFQWRDANGRMVYSDMPPPASVAPSAVLRAPARPAPAGGPGGSGATASADAGAAASTGTAVPGQPAPADRAAPQGAADRELEFRKRRVERAEADRKAAEAAEKAKFKLAACEESRSAVRTLESGMRLSRVNEQGEREVVDESVRVGRLETARKSVKDFCGN